MVASIQRDGGRVMAEPEVIPGTLEQNQLPQAASIDKEFVRKLAEACDAVGGVEKKGKNVEKGYMYLRAADVAKAFRHELFSRGIVIFQNEMAPEYIEYRTAKDYRGLDCRIAIEYTITDGESRYSLMAYGQAMDTSDKALYKAKTGALKYFLRGLGILPDEKDDVEADSPEARITEAEKAADQREELAQRRIAEEKAKVTQQLKDSLQKEAVPPSSYISEAQRKRLFAIGKQLRLSESEIREAVGACGYEHTAEIPKTAYNKVIDFMDPDFKFHDQKLAH